MSTLALEINDAGIVACGGGSGGTLPASPGYAWIQGDTIVTGEAACRMARKRPREVHRGFWSELDTAPLARPFPDQLSAADLAHAHLQDLWTRLQDGATDVLLAVPGCESDARLGLLLAIARACGMPATGMVDAAVAACSSVPGERLLHLDLQLHRVVLTEIRGQDRRARVSVKVSGAIGLASLQDLWARHVAALFVRQTRFDPLHGGDSEQDLYQSLAGILEELLEVEHVELPLASGGTRHAVELSRAGMVEAVAAAYDGILYMVGCEDPGAATVVLSSRVARLPGLGDRLGEAGAAAVETLPEEAAAAGALAHQGAIRSPGESLPFVTRLPGPKSPPAARTGTDGAA